VPDMDALAAHEGYGQRLVIRRTITGFEAQLADCSLSSLTVAVMRSPISRAVRSVARSALMPLRESSSIQMTLTLCRLANPISSYSKLRARMRQMCDSEVDRMASGGLPHGPRSD